MFKEGRSIQQLAGADFQIGCQLVDHIDGGVSRTPLDIADVSAVYPHLMRKRLLRLPEFEAQPSQVLCKAFANVHPPKVAGL